MEFYEGDMAMVCDVDEERSSGLRKSGACRKRTCNYRYQAANSQIQLKHSSSHGLFSSIDVIRSVGWAIVTTPSPRSDRGRARIYPMRLICFSAPTLGGSRGRADRPLGGEGAQGTNSTRDGPNNAPRRRVMSRSSQHRG